MWGREPRPPGHGAAITPRKARSCPSPPKKTIVRMMAFARCFHQIEIQSSSTYEGFFPCMKGRQSLSECRKTGPQILFTCDFPCWFPNDFLMKLAVKIANGHHMITGHLATSFKCGQVAKTCNVLWQPSWLQTIIKQPVLSWGLPACKKWIHDKAFIIFILSSSQSMKPALWPIENGA